MRSRRGHLVSAVGFLLHVPMAAFGQRHEHRRPGAAAVGGVPAAGLRHDTPATIAMEESTGPLLRVEVTAVADGRYELRLATENFTFTPETAGEARVVGAGHAHLYVDGEKIGRVYAASSLLPALAAGVHVVDVELSAADHAVYVVAGRPVAARLVLRTAASRAKHVERSLRAFSLAIERGAVAQQVLRVVQGETVRIDWHSDAPLTVHLHGYDIEAELDPGRPLTMQFDADIQGRFPIADHGAGRRGGHVHRALAYVEVHPK